MIPKIIHYCWFGHGEMTPLMHKCIKSWKKYCPDYKIIEWNEENFDISSSIWTSQAYHAKKYAFVADYVRLYALMKYGGIYMDTDQELIKPLDTFLAKDMFLGFMDTQISAGLIGSASDSEMLKEFFDYYQDKEFLFNGKLDQTPNTLWMTNLLLAHGLKIKDVYQKVNGVEIYPRTYFCPTNCDSIKNFHSSETVAIHHWAMTWRSEKAKKSFALAKRHQRKWYKIYIYLRYLPNRVIRRFLGDTFIDNLKLRLKK